MQTPRTWIWEHPDWPRCHWDQGSLAPALACARLAQGKVLGAARLLDANLTLEALAAILVHPFEDGNGRLARAIADMAQAQDERQPMRLFSLSAQILRERDTYYAIPEGTQRGGVDVTAWLSWFLAQVDASATAAEKTVANTLAKARFRLRHCTSDLNARQRKALDRLLDAGPNGFEGGLTTRKYMGLTKTSRATAYRELAALVAEGCLVPTGKGGATAATRSCGDRPASDLAGDPRARNAALRCRHRARWWAQPGPAPPAIRSTALATAEAVSEAGPGRSRGQSTVSR